MPTQRKFNLRRSDDSVLTIDPATIPTLVPSNVLTEFQAGDSNPYYKIEKIEYPTYANGYTYIESFWDSYINKLNRAPIPGSKDGHETRWGARGPTDFINVGGRVDKNGDGTGTVWLKIYVPPKGANTDNTMFIKECKANMVDFSIVSATRDEMQTLPDGTHQWYCVESMGGERNDAVDYGTGAMDMKTNAEGQILNKTCVSYVRSLIAAGKIDNSSPWSFTSSDENKLLGTNGDDWKAYAKVHMVEDQSATEDTKARWKYPVVKNEMVYRSGLRAVASRASAQGLEDVSNTASDLIKEIDSKKKKKGNTMDGDETIVTKEAILGALPAMKQNALITLPEIAKAMGLESQLKTDADVAALTKLNAIEKIVGVENTLAVVQELADAMKQNATVLRKNALVKAFGAESAKVGDKDVTNPAFEYAEKVTRDLSGEKLNQAITALADDNIMKNIRAGMADQDSPFNVIEESTKKNADVKSGLRIMDY